MFQVGETGIEEEEEVEDEEGGREGGGGGKLPITVAARKA
jgi:hypothetical protein